ncbi:MAG TPA: glycosyltransferase family 2 protein [Negativicutes bacterium]|nr:glycosyltransferase family 2 protein [Negativicutes bacterium]
MSTISLCMIVKNEEAHLGKCLLSVKNSVDEIIVVDTGSTDATKEIARRYTDKVLDFIWVDDFSKARNFSFEQASMDYILWLDADDVLLEADQIKLRQLKETMNPSVDSVMMPYHTAFDSNGRPTFSFYRERLVKRERQFRWKEAVHEYLEVSGNILQSDVAITHTKTGGVSTGRNIAIYERLLSNGVQLSPRGMYYYARELKDAGRFKDAIQSFKSFVDTGKGWIEDNITACMDLAACFAHENLRDEQLKALTRSFIYDTPRAEVCCALGYAWKSEADYKRAAFWFYLATTLKKPVNSWGFVREDCWTYIPCIELAACYDKLGLTQLAEHYNNEAGKFKPDDPAVQYNQRYFEELKAKLPKT